MRDGNIWLSCRKYMALFAGGHVVCGTGTRRPFWQRPSEPRRIDEPDGAELDHPVLGNLVTSSCGPVCGDQQPRKTVRCRRSSTLHVRLGGNRALGGIQAQLEGREAQAWKDIPAVPLCPNR
jgi:hypothetical protein